MTITITVIITTLRITYETNTITQKERRKKLANNTVEHDRLFSASFPSEKSMQPSCRVTERVNLLFRWERPLSVASPARSTDFCLRRCRRPLHPAALRRRPSNTHKNCLKNSSPQISRSGIFPIHRTNMSLSLNRILILTLILLAHNARPTLPRMCVKDTLQNFPAHANHSQHGGPKVSTELSVGPFLLTQPKPTHQVTNPTRRNPLSGELTGPISNQTHTQLNPYTSYNN